MRGKAAGVGEARAAEMASCGYLRSWPWLRGANRESLRVMNQGVTWYNWSFTTTSQQNYSWMGRAGVERRSIVSAWQLMWSCPKRFWKPTAKAGVKGMKAPVGWTKKLIYMWDKSKHDFLIIGRHKKRSQE